MKILMMAKTTKEHFSTKESPATEVTNQTGFYKYKTPGRATH